MEEIAKILSLVGIKLTSLLARYICKHFYIYPMETVIFILFLLIGFSILRSVLKQKRESLYNKMEISLDRIELELLRNNSIIDRDITDYLKGLKSIIANKELADIKVIVSMRLLIPNQEWDKIIARDNLVKSKIPQGAREEESNINKYFGRLVLMSMFNLEFFFLTLFKITKTLVVRGLKGVKSLKKKYSESLRFELVLSQYSSKQQFGSVA